MTPRADANNSRPDVPARTVLFDFDDTVVRGDAFFGFILDLLRKEPRRLPATLVCASAVGLGVAHPKTIAPAVSALLWSAVLGLDRAALAQRMDAFVAARVRRGGWLHAQAKLTIERHRAEGARVVVVTGCEQSLAERICQALALGELEIVGSQIVPYARSFIVGEHCHHTKKLACLARHGIEPPWDRVYTDSARDLPILQHAQRATLVNPSRRTARLAHRLFGERVEVVRWTVT